MSFRLFIYYCAICGGWAALVGWALGRLTAPEEGVSRAAVQALVLGLALGLALSLVDALWNLSGRLTVEGGIRVLVAVVIGCLAGLLGGTVGEALSKWTHLSAFIVFGWTLTGMLIGASLGVYDILTRLVRQENLRGARRKMLNGMLGGGLGGLVGGLLSVALSGVLQRVSLFQDKPDLWSPSAIGFVVLGLCIGLLIGLAQVILKEAWVRVEVGFRPGRELILTKPETIIGRAEGCDIGLFGGQGVERLHARILQQEQDYVLADAQTPGGTFVNDQRIANPTPLRAGDRIRVGNCVLLFQERKKADGQTPRL
jgi:hypothetical protein